MWGFAAGYNSSVAHYHRHFPRNKIPVSVTLEAWLLFASIAATVVLIRTDVIGQILVHAQEYDTLASFVSGFFFSSGIATPPAMVALAESAVYVPIWQLCIVGAIGSVVGDLVLFRFMRSRLLEYVLDVSLHPGVRRFGRRIAAGPLWWLGPIVGAIVIASPLPDELGLIMMGLSSIRLWQFVSLAFFANVAGIYAIVAVAQAITG
jgi:hypothetical protein